MKSNEKIQNVSKKTSLKPPPTRKMSDEPYRQINLKSFKLSFSALASHYSPTQSQGVREIRDITGV